MDEGERKQLAAECLKRLVPEVLSFITQDARKKTGQDLRLGEVGAQFFMIATRLESTEEDTANVSAKKIKKLLSMLETVCKPPSEEANFGSEFPILRSIAGSRPDRRALEIGFRKLVSNKTEWSNCISIFQSFIPKQRKSPPSPPRADVAVSEYPAHIYECLFTALGQCHQCTCVLPEEQCTLGRKHYGSLALRSRAQEDDDELIFDTVFSVAPTHKEGILERDWRRLKIQVSKRRAKRQLVFQDQHTEHTDAPAEVTTDAGNRRINAQEFCRILQEDHGSIYRCMRAAEGDLALIEDVLPADGRTLAQHPITLAEAMQRSTLTARERLQLAHIIARSVWEYYESPWMCYRWTENTLQFVPVERPARKQERSWHGPFVPMVFGDIRDQLSIVDREYVQSLPVYHRAPRVLALGVILIRVLRGEGPGLTLDGKSETKILNDELMNCRDILKEDWRPFLKHFKSSARESILEAINACFDAKAFSDTKLVSERRKALFDRVVRPLEDIVMGGLAQEEPLMWLSECDPMRSVQMESQTLPLRPVLPTASRTTSKVTAAIKGSFYDAPAAAFNEHAASEADKFLKTQGDLIEGRLGDDLDQHTHVKPIKIAVLDTGIDRKHPNFRKDKRIKAVGDWTDNRNGDGTDMRDEYGHGTHVAGLILTLLDHADLYVARIAKRAPEDPAVIAKALNHAINEWDVDIVVMSFGFDSEQGPGCAALSEALRNAYSKSRLMFAAASNEGLNQPRAFPARDHSVFGIHSTNGKGVPSGFNPQHKQNDHNFSTLGESVQSAWPRALAEDSENPGTVMRRSGSSYATPIAASIAAFVILFARLHLDGEAAERVKSFGKMRDILQATSLQSAGYEYLSLDTMFGLHREQSTIEGDIREILAGTYRK